MAEILQSNADIITKTIQADSTEGLKEIILQILRRDEELRRTLNDMLYNLNEDNIGSLDFNKILYYNLKNTV